jgi:signal transduction histidine kinase
VGIILEIRSEEIMCIIEDDGNGMSEVTATEGVPRRLGLLGMRERIALIDGAMEIETSQTRGTTLFVKVPLGALAD